MALLVGLLAPAGPARSGEMTSRPGSPRLATPQLLDRAVARGRLDRRTANLYLAYAFGAPHRLPRAFVSSVPWDGTLPLLRLQRRLAHMRAGPTRNRIETTLRSGVLASCSGESGSGTITTSPHFYVDHGTIGGGLTITDYTTSLESTWTTEVDTFGWAAPPLLASDPPGSRYPVVIASLGTGLYGFVSTSGSFAGLAGDNPNTGWTEPDAFRSCMTLNDDYGPFPGTPQQALDATTAHEFNHSIQFGYGALTGANRADFVFTEGGATWMEDEVFDGANDNYNYLWPSFTEAMGSYRESLPMNQQNPYPYWVVFRALTERYGASVSGGGEDVMQDYWEAVSQSATAVDLNALNAGLVNKGTTLPDAYHAAAVALKFNQACGPSLAYPFCLEEGPAYVAFPGNGPTPVQGSIASVGGSFSGSVRDNYALNWVTLPASGPYDVTLQNTSAAGQLRGTVACSKGAGLSILALPAVVGTGSSTTLAGFDPSAFACTGNPVAVITNQSQTAADPSSSTARNYTLSTTSPGGTSRLLGVTLGGTGSGTVTSNPAGISCPGDCTESYADATSVMLTASALAGSSFQGWGGDCSGTSSTCMVSMTAARSVTATFDSFAHDLDVVVVGSGLGTVTSAPAGITCPADCGEAFADGTPVTLTAAPAAGSAFSAWAGNCSGSSPTCELTMTADRSVTASFNLIPQPEPGPKSVSLSARPRKVEKGERTRLSAVVSPCAGHEGDLVEFYRGAKKIKTKASNALCTAKVRVRMKKTARFLAVSPQQDADHLAGTSNKVKVRVLAA